MIITRYSCAQGKCYWKKTYVVPYKCIKILSLNFFFFSTNLMKIWRIENKIYNFDELTKNEINFRVSLYYEWFNSHFFGRPWIGDLSNPTMTYPTQQDTRINLQLTTMIWKIRKRNPRTTPSGSQSPKSPNKLNIFAIKLCVHTHSYKVVETISTKYRK